MLELSMSLINEPPLPVRTAMDDVKMEELMGSMRVMGLLQPILVYPKGERFEIEAGHRRFLAARNLGWAEIRAIVFPDGTLIHHAALLHENAFREDMNAADEAQFYGELLELYGLDEDGLCAMVRHTPDYVADRFRLMRGDSQIFDAVRAGKIKLAVARELNKVTDETMRRYYLDQACRSGCASRVVAQWVVDWKLQGMPAPAASLPAELAEEEPRAGVAPLACEFCGGSKDPYNLISIMVHRWELDQIRAALRRPPETVE